jgi:Spy/CpxP family protein refolding chaperone
MKRISPSFCLIALLAGISGLAQAQPAPGMGPGAGEGMPARMQAHMQQRAADLKAKLKLSPEQEAAWSTYAAAMKPAAPMQRPDRGELEKLSTPERLDKLHALRQQHEAAMDQREQATRTFYATLTPEQKQTFDANTLHGFAHRTTRRLN